MERMPLGISELDSIVGGGPPTGSVVLLAGDSGAGAREFCYTSAATNALAHADDELFELYYGSLADDVTLPEEVHYLSFTRDRPAIESEMTFVMESAMIEAAVERIEFADLSGEYFGLTPVPSEWYAETPAEITSLADRGSRRDVYDALGSYLSEHAAGNLVVIDSITDLAAGAGSEYGFADLSMMLRGLTRVAHRWNGLVLLLASVEPLDSTELGTLKSAADGTLRFAWDTGGSQRARTLVVEQFRGVLSRLREENVVRFETEIRDAGFDISNVRKIR